MLWLREMIDPSSLGDAAKLRSMIDAAARVVADGDQDLAVNLLWRVRSGASGATRARRRGTVSSPPPSSCTWTTATRGCWRSLPMWRRSSAAGSSSTVCRNWRRTAAMPKRRACWALPRWWSGPSIWGPDSLPPRVLACVLRAGSAIWRGCFTLPGLGGGLSRRLEDGHARREEASQLATETREPLWAASAQVVKAMLAALRGERAVADTQAAEAERAVSPIGARFLLAIAQLARGLAALGVGRHDDAYQHLRRVFDPADAAYHPFIRTWAIGDLAEAAAHSGHRDEARAVLAELEPLAAQTPSSWFQAGMHHARPLLAADQDAERLFQAALDADLTRWPVLRPRLQLAYGAWLRRQRRVAESRAPLRAAREAFDALGAIPWGERARQELRASGEASKSATPPAWDRLSPQELQIAQLAADGLSNREIGQQLYLSHRTVSSYLYRVYPKLGVGSQVPAAGDVGVHGCHESGVAVGIVGIAEALGADFGQGGVAEPAVFVEAVHSRPSRRMVRRRRPRPCSTRGRAC